MASIVVPFREAACKTRLVPLPQEERLDVALAMLEDVLRSCRAVAPTLLVTEGSGAAARAEDLGVSVVADPGGGLGHALTRTLDEIADWPVAIVNADLPAAEPRDVLALLGNLPRSGIALVAAADGTTNALAATERSTFEPTFGPGSALRFQARARERGYECRAIEIPNLADDVDTLADLQRVARRVGPSTARVLAPLALNAA